MAIRNRDNELQEPRGAMRHLNDTNERDDEKGEGFIPTRNELKQSYLYWADRHIDCEYSMFAFDDIHCWRTSVDAAEQLKWIGRLLGKDTSKRLWDSVESRYAKEGGQLWRAYKSGDHATRDSFLDELNKGVDDKCRRSKGGVRRACANKENDARASGKASAGKRRSRAGK